VDAGDRLFQRFHAGTIRRQGAVCPSESLRRGCAPERFARRPRTRSSGIRNPCTIEVSENSSLWPLLRGRLGRVHASHQSRGRLHHD
jgi:hypothetical protein